MEVLNDANSTAGFSGRFSVSFVLYLLLSELVSWRMGGSYRWRARHSDANFVRWWTSIKVLVDFLALFKHVKRWDEDLWYTCIFLTWPMCGCHYYTVIFEYTAYARRPLIKFCQIVFLFIKGLAAIREYMDVYLDLTREKRRHVSDR
jgi:hypothetical protein